MANNFITEYNKLKRIQKAYDSAVTKEGKDNARLSYRELTERINNKGSDYADFFGDSSVLGVQGIITLISVRLLLTGTFLL